MIMAELQWLAMPVVAIIALIISVVFGVYSLRNDVTRQERAAGRDSGRIETKLEHVEHQLETVVAKVESVEQLVRDTNAKLQAHDLILADMRGEAKKLSRRMRKLSRRVKALESRDTPPTEPDGRPTAVVTDFPSRRSE